MTLGRRRVSAVTILVGLVMLLVPALAWMQYQWLGQLSTAERDRMQRTLRTAAAQFATEFDTELSRTLVSLQVDGQMIREQNWTGYAQRYSAWTNSTSEPRLVRDVMLVDTLPGTELPVLDEGAAIPIDRMRLRKWNTQALTFEDAAWPDDLLTTRDSLATRFIGLQAAVRGGRPNEAAATHRETSISLALGDDNTLISPVTLFELPEERRGPPKISILGFTIVRLDPAIVRDTILAALTLRHFHGSDSEVDYRVAVVHRDDVKNVVWESEPGVAAQVTAAPDVKQSFMGPRPEQMFVFARNLRGESVPVPPPPPSPGDSGAAPRIPSDPAAKIDIRGDNIVVSMIEREGRGGGRDGGARIMSRGGQFGNFDGRWVLMAKHRAGSLEAAVAAVRMKNLFISSSVLLLLTIAIGLIVVSARRAQNLARQQMEFVAAVSHELRTPVSVIGAAAGNLADGVVGDPQRVRKYGETIQGEARRLAETVERVLQLAGIAAGRAAAAQVPIQPAELIEESLGVCRTEIERAGVNVEVAVAENLPNVIGDTAALKSALQNLISNAVKYGGPARWLRVSAKLDPGVGARQQVIFTVEDHGMGIEADDRKHIFEPFYRGRDAVSQQIQGSGLGLNLVMRIAEAHGGTVNVTSEPGKGSTFTLLLPAVHDRPTVEYVEGSSDPPEPMSEKRLLLVEDEPGLQLALSDRLSAEGYSVETAGDGNVAVTRATGEPFDVIVLDVMLPGRDGFDVAKTIRQQGIQTPILMLTARTQVVDRVVGLKLGADDYLTKPFETIELLARIEALLRRAPSGAAGVSLERYQFGDILVDVRKAEVTHKGQFLDLSAKEFQLLKYFIEHRGATVSRDELLQEVWGYNAMPSTRTVDVHVAWLRQKLEPNPRVPQYILTVHGMGYKFAG